MSSLTVHSLTYLPDLMAHYRRLSDLPGFILLESTDRILGRYDILSALPYTHLTIHNDEANLHSALADCEKQLPSYLHSTYVHPFQGGAIGYISYDLGARMHGIHSPIPSAMADMPLLDLGLYDWAIVVDHDKKSVDLIAAHHCGETKGIIPDILHRWNTPFENDDHIHFEWQTSLNPLISRTSYEAAFSRIHYAISQGRMYQTNYAIPFTSRYAGAPWDAYRLLRKKHRVPYAGFIQRQNEAIVSLSPERFLLQQDSHMLTSPIKGTIKRSFNDDENDALKQVLRTCEKNRAENIMIVDLMRNDLGKIAVSGSVIVSKLCELQSVYSVHHLVSDIQAVRRKDISQWQAILACFPGGSITGAPKQEAMHVIAEEEKKGRGIYCGGIGYISAHGRSDFNIAIRTGLFKNNTLHMWAGGGIVIDSTAEAEYGECLAKLSALFEDQS